MGNGLYFQTDFGSGLDNVPRAQLKKGTWADASLQMALFARHMSQMADVLNNRTDAAHWQREYARLKAATNRVNWNVDDGFYYDVQPNGEPTRVKYLGAYWSLLSEVADQQQAAALVAHLKDPKHFYRPHLFPSLAASHPDYDPMGNYWVGGVWASTNYMVVKGLERRGYRNFAREAAENHIDNMVKVLNAKIDEARINPPERDGDYQSIWECYSPEHPLPGTGADKNIFSRHHFVGWSGAGPIAMLFENVLGFDVSGVDHTVTWHVSRTDRHGVRNMPMGAKDSFDLIASARDAASGRIVISGRASRPFTLKLMVDGWKPKTLRIPARQFEMQVRR